MRKHYAKFEQVSSKFDYHFVSGTKIFENCCLLVDYNSIFSFSWTKNGCDLTPVNIVNKPDKFFPTGIFYSEFLNQIFVANYLGNNILIFNFDGLELSFIGSIEHPTLISPENIGVSPDGNIIAVANYDGNNFAIFSRKDACWEFDGAIDCFQCHGVTLDNENVFASSLQSKEIFRYSLISKKIELVVGGPGHDCKKPEFLWPTSLFLSDNRLFVLDSHLAKIFELDINTFAVKNCFGSSGLDPGEFNMPYGLLAGPEDTILVVDPFNSSIAALNYNLVVSKSGPHVLFNQLPMSPQSKPKLIHAERNKKGSRFYNASVEMPTCLQKFELDYNGLYSFEDNLFVSLGGLPNNLSGTNFYLVDILKLSSNSFILFSPQTKQYIYIDNSLDPLFFIGSLPSNGFFKTVDNTLISNFGSFPTDDDLSFFESKARELKSLKMQNLPGELECAMPAFLGVSCERFQQFKEQLCQDLAFESSFFANPLDTGKIEKYRMNLKSFLATDEYKQIPIEYLFATIIFFGVSIP